MVVFPLLVCIVVVVWIVRTAESIFGAIPRLLFPPEWYFPGLGILIAVAVILAVGMFLHAWVFSRLIQSGERLLGRIPLFKTLYNGVRDLLGFFSGGGEKNDLKHVVLVELQKDIHAIGFVTASDAGQDFPEMHRDDDEPIVAVYLQMGYQVGGYTLYVPASRVRPLDIPVEEALRVVLTANVAHPQSERGERKKGTSPRT